MTAELLIDNRGREAIHTILMDIQHRWQNTPQPKIEDLSTNNNLLPVTDCAVDKNADFTICDATMAETMILQRSDVAGLTANPTKIEEPATEINETIILAPSSTPPNPPMSALEQLSVADNFTPPPNTGDEVSANTTFAPLGDSDSLAKTQILNRFSSENVGHPAPALSENRLPPDEDFAATIIFNPAANNSPRSQSPPSSLENFSEGGEDLAKTCILQPFTGVSNNSPVVKNKATTTNVADHKINGNGPPDSLLETVIIPSGMGKPNR